MEQAYRKDSWIKLHYTFWETKSAVITAALAPCTELPSWRNTIKRPKLLNCLCISALAIDLYSDLLRRRILRHLWLHSSCPFETIPVLVGVWDPRLLSSTMPTWRIWCFTRGCIDKYAGTREKSASVAGNRPLACGERWSINSMEGNRAQRYLRKFCTVARRHNADLLGSSSIVPVL